MPPSPQPAAPAKVAMSPFAIQSFLFARIKIEREPIAPAQAAPCSCPNWPRMAQAVPSAMPASNMLHTIFLLYIFCRF